MIKVFSLKYIRRGCLSWLILALTLAACSQSLSRDAEEESSDAGEESGEDESRFADYAIPPGSRDDVELYYEELLRHLELHGLESRMKSYALTLNVYVVTENVLRGDMSPRRSIEGNVVLGCTRDCKQIEYDKPLLKEFLTGWGALSINPILYQAGIWIKTAHICEIRDPVGNGEMENIDGYITRESFEHRLVVPGNSRCDGVSDGATTVTASSSQFRMLYIREDGVKVSIAALGELGNRIAAHHGRNIIAHEIGHNFFLRHVNQYYHSLSSVCSFVADPSHVMYTPILDGSYGFAPCEVAMIQNGAARFLRNDTFIVYKEGVIKLEDPTERQIEKGILFRENRFVKGFTVDEFEDGNHVLSEIFRTKSIINSLNENNGYPERL